MRDGVEWLHLGGLLKLDDRFLDPSDRREAEGGIPTAFCVAAADRYNANAVQSGHYSIAGILVRTLPGDLPEATARLSALPGVDVHHHETSTGRLVITLEAAEIDDERQGIERVRRETGVISAELVYHYVAPPDEGDASLHAPRLRDS